MCVRERKERERERKERKRERERENVCICSHLHMGKYTYYVNGNSFCSVDLNAIVKLVYDPKTINRQNLFPFITATTFGHLPIYSLPGKPWILMFNRLLNILLLKGLVQNTLKVTKYDMHLKKTRWYSCRNILAITIKMRTPI